MWLDIVIVDVAEEVAAIVAVGCIDSLVTKTRSSTIVLVVELETGVVDSVFVEASFLMDDDGVQVLIILVAATGRIMEAMERWFI